MPIRWWSLQDAGDREPYAVMCLDDADGLPRRFVPGEGLVHWPNLAGYAVNGETGARPISAEQALALIEQEVGRIDPGYVALARGQGETIQPPEPDPGGAPDPGAAPAPPEAADAPVKPPEQTTEIQA